MKLRTDFRVLSRREMRYDRRGSRCPASRNFRDTSSNVTEHCEKAWAAGKNFPSSKRARACADVTVSLCPAVYSGQGVRWSSLVKGDTMSTHLGVLKRSFKVPLLEINLPNIPILIPHAKLKERLVGIHPICLPYWINSQSANNLVGFLTAEK